MCKLPTDDPDPTSAPLWNRRIERDLRRIATEKSLSPPPSDPSDARWAKAWAHFELTYVPAMRAYLVHLLRKGRPAATARQEAEELVRAFVSQRLEDGRLESSSGPIRSFRNWLATQLRRFVFSEQRSTNTQRRRPEGAVASLDRARHVAAPGSERDALRRFDEQLVEEIADAVLRRVAARSEDQAAVLRDLIRNAGVQSEDFALRLGLTPRELVALRSRARTSFQQELIAITRTGLFTDADIEDLLDPMRRRYGRRP